MYKRTEAYCRDASAFQGMLNNGRSCKKPYQCKSRICTDGKCDGLYEGQTCNSHEDCDAMKYCKKDNQWPWTSECTGLRPAYEQCNETYECHPSAFCWYAIPEDVDIGKKSCLPKYSQDIGTSFGWQSVSADPLEDMKHNGQYCMTGLAYETKASGTGKPQAQCSLVQHITFDDQELAHPYKCNPTK